MRILIDADGCPVVDIAVGLAKQHKVECIILCDTSHSFQKVGATTVIVSKGADSVDFALVNMVQNGDIVITQDYGLAAMCLARHALPISQNGLIYSKDNIDGLLMQRHSAREIRMAGGKMKAHAKRKDCQNQDFKETLQAYLQNIK